MGSDIDNMYLDRIEWEFIEKNLALTENIEGKYFKNNISEIKLWRDDDYNIKGEVNYIFEEYKNKFSYENKPGELIKPITFIGENYHTREKFKLERCYIGNQKFSMQDDNYGNILINCIAALSTGYVEKSLGCESEVIWITDWYINGPKVAKVYLNYTKRELYKEYIRERELKNKSKTEFKGDIKIKSSLDYSFVNCEKVKFIIHSVPNKYEPQWSEKIGIEYRKEFGIPNIEDRKSISEIVSFVVGRQLLNIGSSEFDSNGYPIKQIFLNTPVSDVRRLCNQNELPPIDLELYSNSYNIESILKELVPKYIELKDQLKLNEALYRYWISNQLPIGINLPILANGIEILAKSWFKSNKCKMKGVYMDKNEFDKITESNIKDIELKMKDVEYSDRIIRRMKNAFQFGANESLEIFFNEIGLKIGDLEKKAIKARNEMIHSNSDYSQEKLEKMIVLSKAYRTLFNRIFLTLLQYKGDYIDYSVVGFPRKNIGEPLG